MEKVGREAELFWMSHSLLIFRLVLSTDKAPTLPPDCLGQLCHDGKFLGKAFAMSCGITSPDTIGVYSRIRSLEAISQTSP